MQAKDIPDDLFVQAVADCSVAAAQEWGRPSAWANRMDVERWLSEHMGREVPWKVVVAKAKKVIAKGRMAGCTCGCRGDFDLRGFADDPFTAEPTWPVLPFGESLDRRVRRVLEKISTGSGSGESR